ncbi:MAG: C69 family dipeptidase [Chlamydiota bacterium]
MKSLFLVFFGFSFSLYSCTSILITKGASVDGSVIVSHSDDNYLSDHRIIYVPAMDHKKGTKRMVCYDKATSESVLVRYVGKDRGPNYEEPLLPQTPLLGSIDQVPHTYAYFDGSYGIMNEHQLMIGETTCGSKVEPKPKEGKRIFYSSELSRVALERCTTAREAIKLIGDLIDGYGYYGPGEVLLIGDKEEGWVLEMCGGTIDEKKGLWVAKKVPDGEIFVSANEFRIREVDPNDPCMMFSKNLFDEVQKRGWWNPKEGQLDWLKAVSYGEMEHPYNALRRVWRVFSIVKPSVSFSPWVKDGYTKEYPFSIKPDQKLSVSDVMKLHRDHYEGTEFDLTKGLASGPFGSPARYIGPYDGESENGLRDKKMWGAFERPIAMFLCGFVYINQARSYLPDPIGGICWFGPDNPTTTCFVPFFVGVFNLPKSYQIGNSLKFDRKSAWWAFNFVSNLSLIKFSYMKKDILLQQERIERKELSDIPNVEAKALGLYKKDPKQCIEYLTDYCMKNSEDVFGKWWDLSEQLLVKYNEGFINTSSDDFAKKVGYPVEWLKQVGYEKGPISYQKPKKGKP